MFQNVLFGENVHYGCFRNGRFGLVSKKVKVETRRFMDVFKWTFSRNGRFQKGRFPKRTFSKRTFSVLLLGMFIKHPFRKRPFRENICYGRFKHP